MPIPPYERVKVDSADFGDAPTSQDVSRLQSVVPQDRKGRIEARLDRQATEAFRVEIRARKDAQAGTPAVRYVVAAVLVLATLFVVVAVTGAVLLVALS